MSYLTQGEIAENTSMNTRIAQCVATERDLVAQEVDAWVWDNRREWAAAPGWDAAWESARVSNPDPDYDPGADPGVITDLQILSQVQSMP